MLNSPNYDFKYGDMKFYYRIHVQRQRMLGNIPLGYDGFIKRAKTMSLYDAIYKPRVRDVRRWRSSTPIQDKIRRAEKLKEENIMVASFEEMKKIEKYTKPPKKNLIQRFRSLFK